MTLHTVLSGHGLAS